jgi:HAD superfamily hydrolase (TIGR01490 family)
MTRRAALFDMDRTLLRVETASLYVRYQREIGEATARDALQVGWWVLLYTFGLLDAHKVAARVIAKQTGQSEEAMEARCEDFVRRYVAQHVTSAARAAVARHRERGDLLAIVTGASPYVARPVARIVGIPHVVSSELEVLDGRFTGRPSPPLCYAEGKIVRATKLAEAHGFTLADATFYSDSFTDLPLLAAVGEAVAVNPDPRLAREARLRKWRVERW